MKVSVIESYAVFGIVEYLQVADSFVVRDIVVLVVPAISSLEGDGLERVGGKSDSIYS